MVQFVCHIALILLLALIFLQDWKYRAVHWVLFPLVFAVSIFTFISQGYTIRFLLANSLFLITVFTLLTCYVSIKRGQWVNILKSDLGLGDVLFLLAIVPLFMDRNYILFFITGMLLSVLIHLIIFTKNQSPKIPLAGYLSVYLIALIAVDIWLPINLFFTPMI